MQISKPLTLASKSAVRAEVLKGAGLSFSIAPSGVDEDALKQTHAGDPPGLAVALAEAKAKAAASAKADAAAAEVRLSVAELGQNQASEGKNGNRT